MNKLSNKINLDIRNRAMKKLADADIEALINERKSSFPGSLKDYLFPTDETKIRDIIYDPAISGVMSGLPAGAAGMIGGALLSSALRGGRGTLREALLGGGLGALGAGGLGSISGYLGRRRDNSEKASILKELGDPDATMYDAEGSEKYRQRLYRRNIDDQGEAIAKALLSAMNNDV